MKAPIFLCSIALAALTACSGGGGGSSTPAVTYSPVGTFSGIATSPLEGQAGMALKISTDGSGEFAVKYPNVNAVDFTFSAYIGRISGSNFDISNTTLGLNGVDTGCPFSLRATMQSSNELDGSYAVGNNTAKCGNAVTIPFKLSRAQLQDFEKQHAAQALVQH
jgi:hypothetical protein